MVLVERAPGPVRLMVFSPGKRESAVAAFECCGARVALRRLVLVGGRSGDLGARRAQLCAGLSALMHHERPHKIVVEELARKRRTPSTALALDVVTDVAATAGIPLQARPLRAARRVVCGTLRPSLWNASGIACRRFPQFAWRRPKSYDSANPSERWRYWERAWAAAVLGLAEILPPPG